MKRLLLLLCALLLVSLVSSSDLFAASRSREFRIQTMLAIFWQHAFPLPVLYFVPETPPIDIGDSGSRVSGDADDYANGKALPGPNDQKPEGGRTLGPSLEYGGANRSLEKVR